MVERGKWAESILFLVCVFTVFAQSFLHAEGSKKLEDVIAKKVSYKCKNPRRSVDVREIFSKYDATSVIAQAKILTNDPNEAVRNLGYSLLGGAGRKYENPSARQNIVDMLVEGLKKNINVLAF